MEWRDTGILLSSRKHGETSVILDVLTPSRGRHGGVVRGGTSRKVAPLLQPGAQLDLVWRARLEDHLGIFVVEPQRARAAIAMQDRLSLAGLNAVLALLSFTLPEREPHLALYHRTEQLLDLLGQVELWPLAYLRWERALLEDLGYGLHLEVCAVTGTADDLVFVSPKSGRAVSRAGAGDWADRLMTLPPALKEHGALQNADIAEALAVTGYFLETKIAAGQIGKPLPAARGRFIDRLGQRGIASPCA